MKRLWDKVNRSEGCWEWQGSIRKDGYGRILYNGEAHVVHRIVYMLLHPDEPMPEVVMHTCDNRKCCNPAHLVSGTKRLNNEDRANKDRGHRPIGELNPKAKLTKEDVLAIRKNEATQTAIAKKYGITQAQVSAIKLRKAWSHV